MKRILIFSLLLSCQSEEFSKEKCEKLSREAYKGLPMAASKFAKNCSDFRLKYSQNYCQKAFEDLVMHGDGEKLKNEYGSKILDCFSKRQKGEFLKD